MDSLSMRGTAIRGAGQGKAERVLRLLSTASASSVRTTQASLALAVLMVGGLCSNQALAKRYYVSQQSRASDDNVGSKRAPLRTLGFAISLAEAGDQILVADGDYRSEENGYGIGVIPIVGKGGQSPIRIKSLRGARPLVKKFFVQESKNVHIDGFCLIGDDFAAAQGWQDMPCIVRSPSNVERPDFYAPFEERREQIESEFETYFSIVNALGFESGIDLERCQRIVVRGNEIRGYWAGIQCRGCDRITIQSNRISHTVNGIFSFLPAPSLTNSRISHNIIRQSLDNGIDIREEPANVRIEHNEIAYSGRGHISLQKGAERCRIRCNTVYAGGFYSETMEFPGSSAISVNDCDQGNVVEGNWIGYQKDLTEVDGNGIILDLMRDEARVVVRDNWIAANAGSGINTTISPNALIQRNVLFQNGYGKYDPLRGAGIKLSRDSDVGQILESNWLLWNTVGIKSSRTIRDQNLVDRNFYLSFSAPLIWDSEEPYQEAYYSIRSIRRQLGWERRGFGAVIGPRWLWRYWFGL